jgi:hypothetical protein
MNWLIGLRDWVDARLPIVRAWDTHMGKYYAPKNFNFWFFFGVLSLLVLVNQLLTGVWLTMSFEPSAERAFASVEYIMRDVEYGWLIRYMHSTGASAFFAWSICTCSAGCSTARIASRASWCGSSACSIYLALMAEGFLGYVLPWGQMSYWGAQVIISLFGAIPYFGEDLVQWIRGDYLISGHHPEPFLCAARGRGADHPARAGGAAHPGAARGRFEQPRWRRDQEEEGRQRRAARRRRLPPLLHRARSSSAWWCSCSCSAPCCSSPRDGRLLPGTRELRTGQFAEDACAHCAGVVLHALLLDAARRAGQVRRFRGDGGSDCDHVRAALAGSQPGEVHPLQGCAEPCGDRDLRGLVHHPRRARREAADPGAHCAGAGVHGALFRVLPADAGLHLDREDAAGAGARHHGRRHGAGGSSWRCTRAGRAAGLPAAEGGGLGSRTFDCGTIQCDEFSGRSARQGLAAARREVLHELLHGLPFAEVRAVRTNRNDLGIPLSNWPSST